jgi:tRNA dimethylallyltransferase
MKPDLSTPICIVGPTGTGKSALALALGERLGGEIVSVDAVAVYRGFDIGSAKPDAAARARVPHHLIDVVDWHEGFDAQKFLQRAEAAIEGIVARGRVPILCGGTGLYLRAWRSGLIDAPRDAALRAALDGAEAAVPGAAHRRLQQLDPVTARALGPRNYAHVRRALEISILCGRPASAVRAEHEARSGPRVATMLCLDGADGSLRARLRARAARMLELGLVDEVRGLLGAGASPACQPMQAVGYRQVAQALAAAAAQGRKVDTAALLDAIFAATWLYVRRQRSWLRREARSGGDAAMAALDAELPPAELLSSALRRRAGGGEPTAAGPAPAGAETAAARTGR